MTGEQNALWTKLRDFAFDLPTTSRTFTSRLAHQNGWTVDYARRVVDEYRRFLFLSQAAGHPVSPSEDVDQAWHLHLTYSESYWDDLCAKVLGQPFHHMPAQGGQDEPSRLRQWYKDTLASYRRLFGESPPRDIWPDVEKRFAGASFVRVNRQGYWLVPKPRRASVMAAVVAGLVVLLATGCGRDVFLTVGGPWDLSGPSFLLLYVVLLAVTLLIVLVGRHLGRRPGPMLWSPTELPDAYATAYLAGYLPRALEAALASLLQQGHLVFNQSATWQIMAGVPPTPGAPWFEREVFDYVRDSNVVTYQALRWSGRLCDKASALDGDLVKRGLLLPSHRAFGLRVWTAGLFVLLLCFGLSKIHVGIARERPVGFLIAACVITAIAALVTFFWRTRPTRRGLALLRDLRDEHSEYEFNHVTPTMNGNRVAEAVALFGSTVLIGSALSSLSSRFLTYGPSRGNDGGSSGNGTAGCSAGGGGCGGGGGGGCGGGGGGGGCGGCGGGG